MNALGHTTDASAFVLTALLCSFYMTLYLLSEAPFIGYNFSSYTQA